MASVFQLPYILKLSEAAAFGPEFAGPGAGHIPGSAIWGALAMAWIGRHGAPNGGADGQHADFHRLFPRSGLRCLNAYPCLDALGTRPLPAPLSIVAEKDNRSALHDLAATEVELQTVALDGYACLAGDQVQHPAPCRGFNYHISRPDRKRGRPEQGSGAFFGYDFLKESQEFAGLVLGPSEDLHKLLQTLQWSEDNPLWIEVGRSRATQYGGRASLELAPDAPLPYSTERPQGAFATQKRLVVTLASDLLARDEYGETNSALPFAELSAALAAADVKLSADELKAKLCAQHVRRRLFGGYSGVWRLPRPQWLALAAGSVFVFDDIAIDARQAAIVEAVSLGERSGEGFGRFVLNWHGTKEQYSRVSAKTQKPADRPGGPPPEILRSIALGVAAERYEQAVRDLALANAGQVLASQPRISPALLSRLAELFRGWNAATGSTTEIERRLAAIGEPKIAKEQLSRVLLDGRNLQDHLLEMLREGAAGEPKAVLTSVDTAVPPGLHVVLGQLGIIPSLDPAFVRPLVRLYCLTLCSVMARKTRGERRRGRKEATR